MMMRVRMISCLLHSGRADLVGVSWRRILDRRDLDLRLLVLVHCVVTLSV